MSFRPIKKGTTDVSTVIRIVDSASGAPETAVEHDTSGIALWYRRDGATQTAITEAALASLDAAHSDGGIEHIGDGYYRLDLPDAACATGVNGLLVGGTVTGMVVLGTYIPLVDYDPFDAVRMGMTALPNAAADAAGGLPISDAGGLDLDTKLASTNEVTAARMGALTDWIDGGRLDLLLDGLIAKIIGTLAAGTHNPQSGDAFSRLGAPAGASIAADIAAVPTVGEIQAEMEENGASVLDSLQDRLTATRAGYLDNLSAGGVATAAALSALADTIAALNDVSAAEVVTALMAEALDGSISLKTALQAILSVLCLEVSGGGTTTLAFRNAGDTADRVELTVDANGDRSAATITPDA